MRGVMFLGVGFAVLHASAVSAADLQKTTLTIEGMTCGGCAAAVKLQLERTEGVTACEVSYESTRAEVTYDPEVTAPAKIAESLAARTGYRVTVASPAKDKAVATPHHAGGKCDGDCCRRPPAATQATAAQGLISLLWIDDHARPPVEGSLTERVVFPRDRQTARVGEMGSSEMGDCCITTPSAPDTRCPGCDAKGRPVDRITLKALLRPEALARMSPGAYRFCGTPECSIVYFRPDSTFERGDLAVPVFQKERPGTRTVCYCLVITEVDIARELTERGRSSAAERVTQLVKDERCACEVRNPQGTCCLGNVASATTALAASAPDEVARDA